MIIVPQRSTSIDCVIISDLWQNIASPSLVVFRSFVSGKGPNEKLQLKWRISSSCFTFHHLLNWEKKVHRFQIWVILDQNSTRITMTTYETSGQAHLAKQSTFELVRSLCFCTRFLHQSSRLLGSNSIDTIITRSDQSTSDDQHRNDRTCRSRQIHSGQIPVGCLNCAIQKWKRTKHYHQTGLCQRESKPQTTMKMRKRTHLLRSSNATMKNVPVLNVFVRRVQSKRMFSPVIDRTAEENSVWFDTFPLWIVPVTTFWWQRCWTVQLWWTLLCFSSVRSTLVISPSIIVEFQLQTKRVLNLKHPNI